MAKKVIILKDSALCNIERTSKCKIYFLFLIDFLKANNTYHESSTKTNCILESKNLYSSIIRRIYLTFILEDICETKTELNLDVNELDL